MAGSSLVSGLMGADAASSAADSQAASAANATAVQQQMFQQQQANLAPWMQQGKVGLNALAGQMFNPDGSFNSASALNQPFTQQQFQQSPGYQFQMGQGIDAIQNSAAAKGLTGNTLKDLQRFGQGLANQDWWNAMSAYGNNQNSMFNRLNSISGTGANTAGGIANLGQSTANQIGSNMIGAGNAMAAGQVGGANAISNGMNGGIQNWLLAQQMGQVGGGGGGAGAFGGLGGDSMMMNMG